MLLDFPFPEERVFRYQVMQDILHHLANNPFEEFTQKELATITDSDVSSVSRAVEILEQIIPTITTKPESDLSLNLNTAKILNVTL